MQKYTLPTLLMASVSDSDFITCFDPYGRRTHRRDIMMLPVRQAQTQSRPAGPPAGASAAVGSACCPSRLAEKICNLTVTSSCSLSSCSLSQRVRAESQA